SSVLHSLCAVVVSISRKFKLRAKRELLLFSAGGASFTRWSQFPCMTKSGNRGGFPSFDRKIRVFEGERGSGLGVIGLDASVFGTRVRSCSELRACQTA